MKVFKFSLGALSMMSLTALIILTSSTIQKNDEYKSKSKEKIVKEWYRIWDEGTHEDFVKILAKEVKDHDKNPQFVGSDYDGLVGISQAVTAGFSDVKHNLIDVYYLPNDRIATRWEFVGKHTGNFFGVSATDKMVYFSGQDIMQIKDGKIAEIWHIEELLQAMAQINPQQ